MLFGLLRTSCAHGAASYRKSGVKVAIGKDLAPFSFMGLNGEPKGFFIDYWEKWSEKTGVPVTFVPATFGQGLDLVRTGECDIIPGLLMNDERQKYLDYSVPIHRIKAVILVDNDAAVKSETPLSTLCVGVVARGYAEYYLKTNYPNIKMKGFDSFRGLLDALVGGDIKAIATEYPVFVCAVGEHGRIGDFCIVKNLYERELHAAVPKGNHALLELVNNGLSSISKSEFGHISDRWFIADPPSWTWLKVLSVFAAGALFLAIGVLVHGHRRQASSKRGE